MNLVAPLDLNEWFDRRVEQFLLLTPTSTSPQPVHVLNGFLHHSLSGRRAPRTAVDFVSRRSGGEWAVSNAALREKSPLALPGDDLKLEKARRAVGALIAADRAVYPTFASFQVAHLGLVTSDSTHHHLGDLASQLALNTDAGVEALDTLIQRISEPQPNPHWAVEAILSEPGVLDGLHAQRSTNEAWWFNEERSYTFGSELSALLVRALKLSHRAIDSLLGLEVLGVTATWAGLLAYSQVPSLCLGEGLVPLLCQASEPGRLSSVRQASANVIDQVDGKFQRWMQSLLEEDLVELFRGSVPSGKDAITYLNECRPKRKLSGGRDLASAELEEIYRAWDDVSAERALAATLQEMLTSSMGNKARDWFTAVGRHCGFVGPRRGQVPRLRAEVSLVPSLLLAGIDEEDGPSVPFAQWSSRLADRFGIVIGSNSAAHSMAPRASEDELLENEVEMLALMTALGVSRRFSDGVAEVMNPFHLWSR